MSFSHDDVIKWKHFPHHWPFVRGIHRSPVNSPHKCQWHSSFDVFFDLRLIKRLSKHSRGWWFETLSCPLWRHCNEHIYYGCFVNAYLHLDEMKYISMIKFDSLWLHCKQSCKHWYHDANMWARDYQGRKKSMLSGSKDTEPTVKLYNDFPPIDILQYLSTRWLFDGWIAVALQWHHMSVIAPELTGNSTVCSTDYLDKQQRRIKTMHYRLFLRGIRRRSVDSLTKCQLCGLSCFIVSLKKPLSIKSSYRWYETLWL